MMRKDKSPVRKARKSTAIIIAEKDIADLKADVAWIKKTMWGIALATISGLVTALGTLALMLVRSPLPHGG
jgi:hypothetical protein